ncbi:SDR family oxidoreductase [Deinococcus koreensis]|uniref:NAD(P)-dependent oxidoreductase n=1 Tax=Deinococcus koreensis TaxID=2054903 RepID=A0A2K3UTM9_9DEIO|nr:NAD(P)-dependent oxidoreductase [Deinococcus koreensis]PNY79887.1 NAD(P)-dependent oxidoreductase [Deinococcus koreensis]
MTSPKILLTGGGGRLGTELRAILPQIIAPSSKELDVTDAQQVHTILQRENPQIVVHAAAYTNVGLAETERDRCWRINVEGTRNVARAANAIGAKLVHISTDYVFSGEKGNYRETDTPGPVVNYYALTKLVAEEAARCAGRFLIVRTSFRPREFQYPVAFSDVFTSQDYVDIIAPLVTEVICHSEQIEYEVLHVATERKSVFELARRRSQTVKMGLRSESTVVLPADVSLNVERWKRIMGLELDPV